MNTGHNITTACWGEVKQHEHYHWALLPWGATEPHNGHLPYCTDMLASTAIACDLAARLEQDGIYARVLPGVPFGSQNPGQTDLPFCIHTRQETQAAILRDIVLSLRHQGICRMLIINGHGGNSFKGMIRDLLAEYPDFLILESEWFTVLRHQDYFEAVPDDHAGEQETSVMMHYYPQLVKMEYAGEGKALSFAIKGLQDKVAWHPRNWSRVTQDTGIGDPSRASAAKGRAYAEEAVRRYAALLKDITLRGELY